MTDDALAKVLEQQDVATAAMLNGDPRPYIDSWAVSPVTGLAAASGRIVAEEFFPSGLAR